jgi:hypothetical protein
MCLMRTNKVTDFLHSVAVRIFLLIVLTTIVAALPRIATAGAVVAAPVCEAGAHQTAGECVPDVLPAAGDTEAGTPLASSLDYATESVLIVEGQNPDTTPVVETTFPDGASIWIPEEDPDGGHQTSMWLDDSPLYSGGWLLQVNGETGTTRWLDVQERLTVTEQDEQSTEYGAGAGALDADRELAGLDELDGPAYGTEDDTAQDTAQVQTVAHTTRIGDSGNRKQMCQAARLILKRLGSTRPIFEDWTWHGAPRVVGAQNDALLDAAERAGLRGNNWPFSVKATAWLHGYVKGCRN